MIRDMFMILFVTCATLGVLVGRGVVSPWAAIIPILIVSVAIFFPLLRMRVYAAGAGRITGDGGAEASAS